MKEGEKFVLRNNNGVEIHEGAEKYSHPIAVGATCHCGEKLIVAPKVFNPAHKKRNPVMVCGDHGVHAFYFKDLVKGNQPHDKG